MGDVAVTEKHLKGVAKFKNINPTESNITNFRKAQKDLEEIYNLEMQLCAEEKRQHRSLSC